MSTPLKRKQQQVLPFFKINPNTNKVPTLKVMQI